MERKFKLMKRSGDSYAGCERSSAPRPHPTFSKEFALKGKAREGNEDHGSTKAIMMIKGNVPGQTTVGNTSSGYMSVATTKN
jgi:hypothetical protein